MVDECLLLPADSEQKQTSIIEQPKNNANYPHKPGYRSSFREGDCNPVTRT